MRLKANRHPAFGYVLYVITKMITKSVKSDLVTKIQSFAEVSTKDFSESEVGKTFAGLAPTVRKVLAAQESAARSDFEKSNGAPAKELQFRFAAIELLSEVFKGQDAKDFAENWNLLKSMVQSRLSLIHYSEKEFLAALNKSLRGEVSGVTKELAEKFQSFLKAYKPDARNLSALLKEFSFTNGLGSLLLSDTKVQNLVEGATREEVEDSTLTIREAVELIAKEKTPYKVIKSKK